MSPISNAIKLAAMNVKSHSHTIGGKRHLFSKKVTAEEAEKKVAEKKAAAAAPKKTEKKLKTAGYGTVDEWLEKLVKIHAVEEGYTNDSEADEWLSKIQDNGDYNEYQEEAIMAYGGHSDVAERLYKNLLTRGYSKASLLNVFKDMKEDGYTMFDEFL